MGIFDSLTKKFQKLSQKEIEGITKGKIFDNDIQRDMYIYNVLGYRGTKDRLDYQNSLLSRVNAANEKYNENGNLEALISEYEFAFIISNPPCASSQNLKLADYYMKAGMNDKAWGYLNQLYATREAPWDKVRFEQARLLKKEKRYAYAIEMYMIGYLYKSEWNNDFQKEMFLKDIKSSANKLGLDNDQREYLAYLVECRVKAKNYDESSLSNAYEKAAAQWNCYETKRKGDAGK